MPSGSPKKPWADPNREGQGKGRQAERFCSRCGNTVKKTRILKTFNLCEYCVKEYQTKRDGVVSCRGCGKVAPTELKEHGGFCNSCICPACGKADPAQVRKSGFCTQCTTAVGDLCRSCGKEAKAQVNRNRGLCDQCAANRKV